MKKFGLIIMMILGLHAYSQNTCSARASCRSDCDDQYASNIQSCSSLLNGSSNPESLEACMNNTERTYDTCLEECEDVNEAI